MVADPVSALLAVALLPVVGWCLYSLVRRPANPDDDPVPRDVVAWHGVMGAVMLLALRATASPGWLWLGATLFVAAVIWSVLRMSSAHAGSHFARLFLMSGAMAAMLVPAGAATAATPESGHGAGHASGMALASPGGSGMLLSGAAALVVALVMVVVALAALALAGRPAPVRVRLSACCEVVMAGAMVVMAAAMA